ncbi:hypothetical protein ACMFMF_000928 [Clarireedia jacksonii]
MLSCSLLRRQARFPAPRSKFSTRHWGTVAYHWFIHGVRLSGIDAVFSIRKATMCQTGSEGCVNSSPASRNIPLYRHAGKMLPFYPVTLPRRRHFSKMVPASYTSSQRSDMQEHGWRPHGFCLCRCNTPASYPHSILLVGSQGTVCFSRLTDRFVFPPRTNTSPSMYENSKDRIQMFFKRTAISKSPLHSLPPVHQRKAYLTDQLELHKYIS